jgi:hypothetical protein
MAKATPWRDFEQLLTKIHEKLAPGATVAHNRFSSDVQVGVGKSTS